MTSQQELFGRMGCPTERLKLSTVEQFECWKTLDGANYVLRRVMKWAGYYVRDWQRHKAKVSCSLIWEQVRREIKLGRLRAKNRGIKLAKWRGYALNNNFHGPLARWILSERPEWKGMFELREIKEVL